MDTADYNPQSELTREEWIRVRAHPHTQEDYKHAWAELGSLKAGMPTNSQVTMAAKIVGALPEKCKERGAFWLLTETYMMLGMA